MREFDIDKSLKIVYTYVRFSFNQGCKKIKEYITVSRIDSYKGTEKYIFISYPHKDKDLVYPVLSRMRDDGYRFWYDEGIDPGTEWDETIAGRIDESDYFIAFVSNNYVASDNCKDELNYARDLSKKCVLVYLEEVALTRGMAMRMNRLQSVFKYKYVDEEDFFEKLYESDGLFEFSSESKEALKKPAESTGKPLEKVDDTSVQKAEPTEEPRATKAQNEFGTIRYPSGDIFEGELINGTPNGKGTLRFVDGSIYEGWFKDGFMHGEGKYRFIQGSVYEGEFKDGAFDGKGKLTLADKSVYEGDFKAGKRCGKGTFSYADGDVYKGEFENDQLNGDGIFFFASGDVYRGGFKNGVYHGQASLSYSNGSVFTGGFKNGAFHGECVHRYPNGRVEESYWENGKRIR